MYLPRSLISHLYLQLLKTHHPLSPPVLILVALEPDAICACRILAALLKRDYIPHKIKPIAGYGDLQNAGQDVIQPMKLVNGGEGGVVVCLGVGGLVDLEAMLGLEVNEDGTGGADRVDIWVFDARRPYNLSNVFGGTSLPAATTAEEHTDPPKLVGVDQGQISRTYRPGKGSIVVFDDGDVQQDLSSQREAWYALEGMPDVEDDGEETDASEPEDEASATPIQDTSRRKRKSWADEDDEEVESDKENQRPRQRRRSNSSSPIPSSPSLSRDLIASTPPSNQYSSPGPATLHQRKEPSARTLRRRFLRAKRKHEATLRAYHAQGTSYSEPISSLVYSLASELGREDNDLLWLSIVGVSSMELYGRTSAGFSLTNHDFNTAVGNAHLGWTGSRGTRIRQLLQDEARRLNPPEITETGREVTRGLATDAIPTHARSPTDNSIRLSPEPRFLLLRHWSLYDSMVHSPYLSAKLHIWSDAGRRRLHKLLAKMGVSLVQCQQSYTHMDMDLKRVLRERLLHFAPQYGLDGLVPPASTGKGHEREGWGFVRSWGWKACLSAADVAVIIGAILEIGKHHSLHQRHGASASHGAGVDTDDPLTRFYAAYDALLAPSTLIDSIPLAQSLHRSILRTGTTLLQKRQIRHLRAFRLGLLKDGPDVSLFCVPGALTKLALWLGEAIAEMDGGMTKRGQEGGTPLVLGCLDDNRGIYVVVGLGGGSAGLQDLQRKKERNEKKEKKAEAKRQRDERREAKRKQRHEERAARGDDEDEDELETEDSASSSDSDSDSGSGSDADSPTASPLKRKQRNNRFGNAFQEVVEETRARVRLDSFEHCVVEVKKEDLSGFLESLSMKVVVG
ncbi:MAG: hypothetical protein M1828_007618 [Chrysothrix sp. TS-e1954]|nr:MAG: hypothetical protein M1828_007618 [Chrysothrix sp. TS-e1954]